MALCKKNPTIIPEDFKFREDFGIGTKSAEVGYLHFLLSADPEMRVNAKNIDVNYFSHDTQEKVAFFQKKYVNRIWMGANADKLGFVGEKTRNMLNAILEGGLPSPKA